MTQEQVSALVGMTQGAYSKLERTGEGSEKTTSLARVLKVDPLWLESNTGTPERAESNTEDYVAVKRVGVSASASISGAPVDFVEEEGEPIYFQKSWLESRGYEATNLLATKVRGESMEPTVYDGDLVVFNTGSKEPADGVAFIVNYEGEVVIKRLSRDAGQWWLDSDNSDKTRFPRKLCIESVTLIGEVVHRQSSRV